MKKFTLSFVYILFFSLSTFCQSTKFDKNKPNQLPFDEVESIFIDSITYKNNFILVSEMRGQYCHLKTKLFPSGTCDSFPNLLPSCC